MSTVRPQIAYERHDFDKTTITIDKHGNLDETISVDESIEISKDWHLFSEGDKPEDGYLSQGATKFAFLVCDSLSHLSFVETLKFRHRADLQVLFMQFFRASHAPTSMRIQTVLIC